MGFFAGKSIAGRRGGRRGPAFALLAGALPLLAGCMSFGIDDALDVDRMTTGAISPVAAPAAPQTDEMAVARAVAEVDLGRRAEGPFAWANSATGSTGVISSLNEAHDEGRTCREFTTSLHRYDGIALFNGTSCVDEAGTWNLTAFETVQ